MHWKVIAALAGVGVGVAIVAPGALAAAVPLLVVMICPLSMLMMMGGMLKGGQAQESRHDTEHMHTARDGRAAELWAELASIDALIAAAPEEIAEGAKRPGPDLAQRRLRPLRSWRQG
jgi:hypothetical protein